MFPDGYLEHQNSKQQPQFSLMLENILPETGSSQSRNEFESLIQFPGLSYSFSAEDQLEQQQDILFPNSSQFIQQEIFNKEAASNLRKNDSVEEDIDHLLTDLFREDGGGVELQTPEIGLSPFPESTEFPSGNNNPGSGTDFFTSESWQLRVHNEFDWQNYDFPDVDQLEDQDVLDARDLIVQTEISNKTQTSHRVEEVAAESTGTKARVDGGGEEGGDDEGEGGGDQDTSSLDQEIMTRVEIPSAEDQKNNIEDIPETIKEIVEDSEKQSEASLSNSQIEAEPQTEDKKEELEEALGGADIEGSPVKSDTDTGVRTRRGRKRKPGTVVDLLVSSYIKKRGSRCKSCVSCRAPDCGECVFCLDKPKFGGPNKKKNACQARRCEKMSTKPDPAQSGPEQQDQSGGAIRKESGDTEGATCKDLSCSDELNFTAEDEEDTKKSGIKPVTRGSAGAKKEKSPKPAVKRKRVSLDESQQRKQPARSKKQNLVPKQKRNSVTN